MKILAVGDVVGKPGRKTLYSFLEKYKDNYDFIIVNGENSAGGFGISEKIADEFLEAGCDVITGGNHTWDKKEFYQYLETSDRAIRPYNYPKGAPGKGYTILKDKKDRKIGILSLQARVFMIPTDCPFTLGKQAIEEIKKETDIIIVDFHGEATSEKIAMGWYLDGEISAIFGTHTHIQTADERILPNGTAYITDLGMTGSENGVIGMQKDLIIAKFLTSLPQKFGVATGNEALRGIELEIDENTGKATDIKRVYWRSNEDIGS